MDTLIEVGISGYASCVAELCTMPIDVIKTRMQVNRGSTLADTARHIGSQGGISAFFNGVDPALLRQMLYGGLRYGLYSPISHALHAGSDEHSMLVNIGAAILSGGTAALIATPLDLLKVRMQLNQGLPGGITKALVTLAKAEGLAGLWRGAGATCARAAFLTAGEKVRGGETRRLPHLPTKNCIPTFTGNCAQAVPTDHRAIHPLPFLLLLASVANWNWRPRLSADGCLSPGELRPHQAASAPLRLLRRRHGFVLRKVRERPGP